MKFEASIIETGYCLSICQVVDFDSLVENEGRKSFFRYEIGNLLYWLFLRLEQQLLKYIKEFFVKMMR